MLALGWDKEPPFRDSANCDGIYSRVWKWERLQFSGDCLAGADLYITGNWGMASICLGRIGAAVAGGTDTIDLIDFGTGRRTEGGGVHLAGFFVIHIPLRPLLYQALSLAKVFLLSGEHVTIWLGGLGGKGRRHTGNQLGKRRRRV